MNPPPKFRSERTLGASEHRVFGIGDTAESDRPSAPPADQSMVIGYEVFGKALLGVPQRIIAMV